MIKDGDVPYPEIEDEEREMITQVTNKIDSHEQVVESKEMLEEKATEDKAINPEEELNLRQDEIENGLQATQDEFIQIVCEKMVCHIKRPCKIGQLCQK